MLKFEGAAHFRHRIVCSTLSGRAIKIKNIRSLEDSPGLKDYEVSFLRLIEKLTNGCRIEINETGTAVVFKPGFVDSGEVTHDCGTARSIGYFLEGILPLLPFAKDKLEITLKGITNDDMDLSADALRTSSIPIVKKFGVEQLELRITKRGAPPNGGGEVFVSCAPVKALSPLYLDSPGKVRRIRGIAYSTRVSPQLSNRVVESAKELLLNFTGDVYINTDHYKGKDSGLSPGFGITLVAETTAGCVLAADCTAKPGELPEDIGKRCARLLLEEIERGGCVDTTSQSLVLLLMVVCSEDVSKIRLGKLSMYTIEFLRHLRDFFGVTFKVKSDAETKTVMLSCLGVGYRNWGRKVV